MAIFDPENRFNPDKIVRPPKMDDSRNFRFPPTYRELPIIPVLDWSAVHLNTREGERPVCCGRTFLAAGMVDEARHEA
jgi:hypothetical protein